MPAQTQVLLRGVPEAQDAAADAAHHQKLPVRRFAKIIALVAIMGGLIDQMPAGLRADQIAGLRPGAAEPLGDTYDLEPWATGQGADILLRPEAGDLSRQAPLVQAQHDVTKPERHGSRWLPGAAFPF